MHIFCSVFIVSEVRATYKQKRSKTNPNNYPCSLNLGMYLRRHSNARCPIFSNTDYIQPVPGNVRTPDAPVSSRFRSASGHPVASGTIALEPMGSTVIKPQTTHANDQSVGGLHLDQSATSVSAHTPAQQNPHPVVLT